MDYSEFEGNLMGGMIKIVIYDSPREIAELVFQEAYDEGIRLQKIFNFFDKESELSNLNRKRKMKVSGEMIEVVEKALEYCEKTGGEYDISIGKQILERKSGKEISKISCSYKDIKINGNEISLENKEVIVDLGSIAKGYIVDKIAEFIKKQGIESFFIDGRGDMISFGKHGEIVEIQHPRKEKETIHQIRITNKSVATSGDYKQFYKNYDKSHIINQKELISVTVVADKLINADIFASAVFLLDKEKREKLIRENLRFMVFTIDKELNEKDYNGFLSLRMMNGEINNEI